MYFGIIAAGEGSRLAGEGASRPKPLIELAGEPMLGRLVRIMKECGAEGIALIVNEKMKDVQEYARRLQAEAGVPMEIVVKSTPSSMHSFYEISRLLKGKGRFITTTVDTVFRPEAFRRYAAGFAAAPADVDGMMAMTGYIDDEKPLYIETDAEGRILAFRDAPWPGARYVSGGIYGLDDKAIGVLERCMEEGCSRMRNFQRALVDAGLSLRGCDIGKILDVDHLGDVEKAEAFLREPATFPNRS